MSVAARRPREREQPAAGVFPLVIGSLRFDLTVGRKPPGCRADERPLMWALVGWVTALRPQGWGGAGRGGADEVGRAGGCPADAAPVWRACAAPDRSSETAADLHCSGPGLSGTGLGPEATAAGV